MKHEHLKCVDCGKINYKNFYVTTFSVNCEYCKNGGDEQ